MDYIHPLFDSDIEEVNPVQLARALGFDVEVASEPDFDPGIEMNQALEYLYTKGDFDGFYTLWKPSPPVGYTLAGKYETEDGPFAFFVKPNTMSAAALLDWYENEFLKVMDAA